MIFRGIKKFAVDCAKSWQFINYGRKISLLERAFCQLRNALHNMDQLNWLKKH